MPSLTATEEATALLLASVKSEMEPEAARCPMILNSVEEGAGDGDGGASDGGKGEL